jgi:signal peptidase I
VAALKVEVRVMADPTVPSPDSPSDRGAFTPPGPRGAQNSPAPTPAGPNGPDWGGLFTLSNTQIILGICAGIALGVGLPALGVEWRVSAAVALVGGVFVGFLSGRTHPVQADKLHVRPAPTQTDGTREIVETVVFVVVLVLLLKSFVAEAFVIPTGSMAETLWGYQKVVTCPDCGINFPVNCSNEVEQNTGNGQPFKVASCTCPNCRLDIQIEPAATEASRQPPENPATTAYATWNSGDRVLVAKFVYDLLNTLPNRLDVVVFKYPGSDTPGGSKQIPMNYIKRLIGLPGEMIAICRGKVYYLTPDKVPSEYRSDPNDSKADPIDRWKKEFTHYENLGPAEELFNQKEDSPFRILRKTPEVILAMMRIVFDNDHPPREGTNVGRDRWQPLEGWASVDQRGFRIPASQEPRRLRYQHILRGKTTPQIITDFMGYNTGRDIHSSGGNESIGNWASDLILECEANIETPTGQLIFELSHGKDRFQARIDVATGKCSLYRLLGTRDNPEEEQLGKTVDTTVKGTGKHRLRFANVDDRLLLWVDETLPFGGVGVPYDSSRRLAPTERNDLERPASILSSAGVTVRHLKLYRDTYYTAAKGGSPNIADVETFRANDPETFKDWEKAPMSAFFVQPGHFLCLGDNSPASADARSWGLVPERLMLGRSLLVYYPFYPLGKVNRIGRIR